MIHEHTYEKMGWAIPFNIVITVVEYIGGIMPGSLPLLYNFTDVLILGYFGGWIIEKNHK